MVYAALIALIYVSKLVYDRIPSLSDRVRKLLFVGTAFTAMFFVCAFRDASVGSDTQNYMVKFTLLRDDSLWNVLTHFYSERLEIGFALLNKLVGVFSSDPHSIIIVSALLFCAGMAVFVYRYTDDHLTAVILLVCCGVYLYAFNITRQMIAVALLMNAWGLLTEKRYKLSTVLFAVSMLFHVTSFVFILVYLFYFLREKKRAVSVAVGVGALLVLLHRPLLMLASKIIHTFSYLDNSQVRISASGIWAVWAIELCIILLYLLYYYAKDTAAGRRLLQKLPHPVGKLSSVTTFCVPIFTALYITFTFMGTTFNRLERFGAFFQPFCILLFLDFGKRLKEQSPLLYRIYLIGLHVCFVIYFVLFATHPEHYRYSFMWN